MPSSKGGGIAAFGRRARLAIKHQNVILGSTGEKMNNTTGEYMLINEMDANIGIRMNAARGTAPRSSRRCS